MPAPKFSTQFRELDEDQQKFLLEMQEALQKGYEDPVFFSEYFLGIPLHEGQKEYLIMSDVIANPLTKRKNILVPCNRWGKTVALAIKHIRYNFYKIGAPREDMDFSALQEMRYGTLDLSPHSNQVVACYNYIFDILHSRFVTVIDGRRTTNSCRIQSFYKGKNDAKNTISFSNHSSFFGASTGEDQGASLAGRQFGFISYDECVFSHHLRTELPGRIMSRTVDLNAPIDLVSTFDAEAKSQQYYFRLVRQGLKGQNEWYVKAGTYGDNSFIPEAIKEEAKKKIMAEDYNKYRQVFLGEAVPGSTKIFDPEIIDNVFSDKLEKAGPIVGHRYLISADWGGSDQGDPTIFIVVDYSSLPYKIVHHEQMQGGDPTIQFALMKILQETYNGAKIIMDTNALGGVLIKKLLKNMGVKTYDFNAHGGEKGEAITQLKLALMDGRKSEIVGGRIIEHSPHYGKLKSYYIAEMEEQLSAYEVKDEKLEQDWVVVLYQAMWFLEKKVSHKTQTHTLTRAKEQTYVRRG